MITDIWIHLAVEPMGECVFEKLLQLYFWKYLKSMKLAQVSRASHVPFPSLRRQVSSLPSLCRLFYTFWGVDVGMAQEIQQGNAHARDMVQGRLQDMVQEMEDLEAGND